MKPFDDLEQTKLFCGAAIDTHAKTLMVRNWKYGSIRGHSTRKLSRCSLGNKLNILKQHSV